MATFTFVDMGEYEDYFGDIIKVMNKHCFRIGCSKWTASKFGVNVHVEFRVTGYREEFEYQDFCRESKGTFPYDDCKLSGYIDGRNFKNMDLLEKALKNLD